MSNYLSARTYRSYTYTYVIGVDCIVGFEAFDYHLILDCYTIIHIYITVNGLSFVSQFPAILYFIKNIFSIEIME